MVSRTDMISRMRVLPTFLYHLWSAFFALFLSFFLLEDVAQGAEQTVCSLHLWLNLKEQAHFLLLEVSPVIVVFRQRVSYVRQQVGFGLSIAEFLRLKLFILPLARPAEAFAVLALLDLMGLGVPVLALARFSCCFLNSAPLS